MNKKSLRKYLSTSLLVAFTTALLAGCGVTEPTKQAIDPMADFDKRPTLTYNKEHYPVTIREINSEGNYKEFTYKEPPERIVAVWQGSIETLIALGVGDRIMAGMGVPDAKYLLPQYREAYEKIPKKTLQDLSVESVLAMKPDFILGWYSTFQPKVLKGSDFWLERGVNTYIAPASVSNKLGLNTKTLDNEYKYILELGKIFDREDKAKSIVDEMKRQINETIAYTEREDEHPRALVMEFDGKDIRVYGKDTLAGNIVTALHGQLLAENQSSISREAMLALNPDVLFVVVTEDDYKNPEQFFDRLYKDPTLGQIQAIKNHRVYILPLYAVYSSGIRTLDGINIIARGLYPDLKLTTSKEFAPDPAVEKQFNPDKK